MTQTLFDRATFDDKLSNRFIELDEGGYVIIYLDRANQTICADHYSNTINDKGLACDPETGEPLACKGNLKRMPTQIYRGRTAKELCIALFETAATAATENSCPITRLDHAAYLGREFQKAEAALYSGQEYIQD